MDGAHALANGCRDNRARANRSASSAWHASPWLAVSLQTSRPSCLSGVLWALGVSLRDLCHARASATALRILVFLSRARRVRI
eukprot:4719396-Pleurochrysis_carterae.AAC.3